MRVTEEHHWIHPQVRDARATRGTHESREHEAGEAQSKSVVDKKRKPEEQYKFETDELERVIDLCF